MTQTLPRTSLYELDYLLWTEDVSKKLRMRDIEGLDFENLIEEIEDLGRFLAGCVTAAKTRIGKSTR